MFTYNTDSAHRRRMSEEEVHRSVAERSSANAREVKYMPDNIDLNKKGEINFLCADGGAISLKMCLCCLRSIYFTLTWFLVLTCGLWNNETGVAGVLDGFRVNLHLLPEIDDTIPRDLPW